MKTIKLVAQIDNKSAGVFLENNGTYLAMTFSASKNFKTEKGALNWLAKRGF